MKTNHTRNVIKDLLPESYVPYDGDDSYRVSLIEDKLRLARIYDLMDDHADKLDAKHYACEPVRKAREKAKKAVALYFGEVDATCNVDQKLSQEISVDDDEVCLVNLGDELSTERVSVDELSERDAWKGISKELMSRWTS